MSSREYKYYPMSQFWENERIAPLAACEARGWAFIHTGGGCTAMMAGDHENLHLLATDVNLDIPQPGVEETDEILIGLYYKEDGDPLVSQEMSWIDFCAHTADYWLARLINVAWCTGKFKQTPTERGG